MILDIYDHNSGGTHSTVRLIIEGKKYVIDGYDRGKLVKEFWGGYGYEYSMTFQEIEIEKLDLDLGENSDYRQAFINNIIAPLINNPRCFSQIKVILDEKGVEYEYFSWRDGS